MTRHAQSILSTVAAGSLLLLALLACKRSHEASPAEQAAESERQTKEVERATKVLATLASLEAKVSTLGAPSAMPGNVLTISPGGYTNFDVLVADELSDPKENPKVRIPSGHSFGKCAAHVKEKTIVSSTDCITPYVVVLKPGTFRPAVVSGSTYTAGKVDVTAYVFDMSNGALLGGGHVTASTPDSLTTKSSHADLELNDKLGDATFESIKSELNVKTS